MEYDLIYQQYFSPVKSYLAAYVGAEHAEELSQEVFLKVANNIESFRAESSLKTWIYRIATNQAKDYLKSRYKKDSELISESDLEHFASDNLDEGSPEQQSIIHEMNDCIKEFILRLPDEYSAVLVLRELEGRDMQEIAETLGISKNAAKVRLHRAKAKLRDEMEHGCRVTTTSDNRMVCERKE